MDHHWDFDKLISNAGRVTVLGVRGGMVYLGTSGYGDMAWARECFVAAVSDVQKAVTVGFGIYDRAGRRFDIANFTR